MEPGRISRKPAGGARHTRNQSSPLFLKSSLEICLLILEREEGGERQTERERDRETDREREIPKLERNINQLPPNQGSNLQTFGA